MLTQTITYEDFLGHQRTETLYFNLSKTEVFDNLYLADEFEALVSSFSGTTEESKLSPEQIGLVLGAIKKMMRLSFGLRSADGLRFIKNDQVWEEFCQSAAYDAFLMSLFENPEKANDFMIGIFPPQSREGVELEQAKASLQLVPQGTRITEDVELPQPTTEDEDFAAILAEADAEAEMPELQAITQRQYDHMKSRLKPAQFDRWMDGKVVQG